MFAVRMNVTEGWKRDEVRINDILSRGIASQSGRSFFSRACARSDAIHIESFNKKFCSPAESAPFCEFKWKSARGGGEPLGVGRRQRIGDGWREGLLACKLKCCYLNANKTPESSSARTSGAVVDRSHTRGAYVAHKNFFKIPASDNERPLNPEIPSTFYDLSENKIFQKDFSRTKIYYIRCFNQLYDKSSLYLMKRLKCTAVISTVTWELSRLLTNFYVGVTSMT